MLWQPQELAQLIVISTDVRFIWKAAAVAVCTFNQPLFPFLDSITMANLYHIVQVLWRMVQLRHQRFLPDVPRLAL